MFQQALSTSYPSGILWAMWSAGNLESSTQMVLSPPAVMMTDTSRVDHCTFLTSPVWWEAVWTHTSLEMSHIFTVLSTDPEAKTDKFEWLRDSEVMASVWLPGLYFLFWLVNFLTFFFFCSIYPPKMTSGWMASVRSKFHIYISGRKLATIA